MPDTIPILLRRRRSYDHDALKADCEAAADRLGVPANLHGSTVLLKPNLISSRAPSLACTDARFARAVAEWFIDCGATVRIGDSPAFGSASRVLARHGIAAALRPLGVAIVEFREAAEHRLSHGVRVGLSEAALACDLLVNLPRVKAHNQMFVTIAVKNLFGVVCGTRKLMCHMKNGPSHLKFADLMLDLTTVVPPSVSLVDGIEAMHRQGPVNGERLRFGCFCAGVDPVAVDTALLAALELDAGRCPVWLAARRRGLPGSRLGAINFTEAVPGDFSGAGFIAPSHLNPVPFNPLRFLASSLRRAGMAAAGPIR